MRNMVCLAILGLTLVFSDVPIIAATKVFLLGGQSNMADCGITSELPLPYAAPQTAVIDLDILFANKFSHAPEPLTIVLWISALTCLMGCTWRKRRQQQLSHLFPGEGHKRRAMLKSRCVIVVITILLVGCEFAEAETPIDIDSRRELFVDDFLIQKRDGVTLRLHSPTPREVVLKYDAPWEGNGCTYRTVFRDGDRIRMWYTGANFFNEDATQFAGHPTYYCYAESQDGVQWIKPKLGLFEFNGSKRNNIVWAVPDLDNFMVFKDPNPECRQGEKYKAVTGRPQKTAGGNVSVVLMALKSSDGIHWSLLKDQPIITAGAFDTLNVAFWDSLRKQYFCYIRGYHAPNAEANPPEDVRDIRVATSKDFLTWSEPELLKYVNAPDESLYTNNIQPYYRAPQIFLGFPTRYVNRVLTPAFEPLPDLEHRQRRMKFEPRFGTVVTDGLFMSSRDGRTFNRWREAFLRPGIERKDNWVYGDCYQNCGLIETASEDPTAPPELSFYVEENHSKPGERTRRYTIRIDGFVSLAASGSGGEALTKPLIFSGDTLAINFSTSAAGSIRIELQDPAGTAIPGYTVDDCYELFGDSLDRVVRWKSGSKLDKLAGKPVRLRFVMKDADLYSIHFK